MTSLRLCPCGRKAWSVPCSACQRTAEQKRKQVERARLAVVKELRSHQDDMLRQGHSLCGPLWDALDRLDAAEREAQS